MGMAAPVTHTGATTLSGGSTLQHRISMQSSMTRGALNAVQIGSINSIRVGAGSVVGPVSSNARPIQRAASIQTYLSVVRDLPCVVAVFEDGAAEPTVITLVRGPRDTIAKTIYEAQASVLRGFPSVAVDFRLLDVARADLRSLGLSMRKIFGR